MLQTVQTSIIYNIERSIIDSFFLLVALFALSQVAFYFAFKFVVSSLDPTRAKRQEAKAKSNRVMGKLGVRSMFNCIRCRFT